MATVRFDNFRWSSNSDPHWDEGHATLELPITNPATGTNYVTANTPIYTLQPVFNEEQYQEYLLLNPDEYAQLPYGAESITFKLAFDYTDNLGAPQVWEMPGLIDTTQYTYGHWILGRYKKESVLYPELLPHALHIDYWAYKITSNLDLILEALLFGETIENEFLPVIILMQDKIWYDYIYTGEGGIPYYPVYPPVPGELPVGKSDLHRTTDRMLRKLAIKGSDIKAAFLEQEADESSADNQAEKFDLYLHFAASLHSGVSETAEYLFDFFTRVLVGSKYTFEDYQEYLSHGGGWYSNDGSGLERREYRDPQPLTTIHVVEGTATGYDVRYGWSYIFEKTFEGEWFDNRQGVAGLSQDPESRQLKPGKCSIQMFQRLEDNTYLYQFGLEEMHGYVPLMGYIGGSGDSGYHDYVIFTRQYADYVDGEITNLYYKRVLVMGLSMEYTINTKTDSLDYKMRKVDIGMFDKDSEGTPLEAFRIALNIATLKGMPFLHREAVVADSLCYTVFLTVKTKVKWYEKTFFKVFIVIAAVVLIVLMVIYGLGDMAIYVADFIVGGAAGGLTIFVTYFVLSFAIGTIIGMAGQVIGGIWGQVFIIIGAIAMARGGAPHTLPGSFGNAVNYINTASPYLLGGQQIYAYYVSEQLQKEWETFMLTARERQRQLDDAWADLDTPDWLDPMMLIRTNDFKAESPAEYLARTKDTNPGVTANNTVHNFVRIALTLPSDPMEKDAVQEMFIGFQKQIGAT